MKVDIVKVHGFLNGIKGSYHAVEAEISLTVIHTNDTQAGAIKWAKDNGYTTNIHRERNMKPTDKHGQFRHH